MTNANIIGYNRTLLFNLLYMKDKKTIMNDIINTHFHLASLIEILQRDEYVSGFRIDEILKPNRDSREMLQTFLNNSVQELDEWLKNPLNNK